MARLKGLEPLTYWFVASHSIQLSYKRLFHRPSFEDCYIIACCVPDCKYFFAQTMTILSSVSDVFQGKTTNYSVA